MQRKDKEVKPKRDHIHLFVKWGKMEEGEEDLIMGAPVDFDWFSECMKPKSTEKLTSKKIK